VARWLQSVEHRSKCAGWVEFCVLIHDRFGQDQHEALIRQLFRIHQIGTVSEYVERFSTLVDQLAAHESDYNPLYYVIRFVDGLRDNIHYGYDSTPPTLDSACALTLVQEEAGDSVKKEYRRYEPSSNQMAHKSAYSLSPPPKIDKPGGNFTGNDHRATEVTRANSVDDKVRALNKYCHARGLSDHCVEKWSYGHQCASTVQLHVI
jgi:hypothetical protein